MEAVINQLTLSDEEDEGLVVQPDSHHESQSYEFCQVGIFLTYNRINFQSMIENMAELWHPLVGVTISDLGANRILFRFYSEVNVICVLEGTHCCLIATCFF